MATVSRFNSEVLALDELYSTAQLKVFEIEPDTALTADAQSGSGPITEGTLRRVVNGLNPMLFQAKSDGEKLVVVMDGHHSDADSLKARVDQILDDEDTIVTEKDSFAGLL